MCHGLCGLADLVGNGIEAGGKIVPAGQPFVIIDVFGDAAHERQKRCDFSEMHIYDYGWMGYDVHVRLCCWPAAKLAGDHAGLADRNRDRQAEASRRTTHTKNKTRYGSALGTLLYHGLLIPDPTVV